MAPKVKDKSTAIARLSRDYMRLKEDPMPYVYAEPVPSNMLEWYYVVCGPKDTAYAGGYYLGRLQFPRDFPFRPPSIFIQTPNGRFKTNTRLCLSMSDFHPDTWNPAWTVSTILVGLLSFMVDESPTLGSIDHSPAERKALAAKSLEYNLNDRHFKEHFPYLVEEIEKELEERKRKEEDAKAAESVGSHVRYYLKEKMDDIATLATNNCFHPIFVNVGIFLGFILFLYIAKYVLFIVTIDS